MWGSADSYTHVMVEIDDFENFFYFKKNVLLSFNLGGAPRRVALIFNNFMQSGQAIAELLTAVYQWIF